MKVYYTIFSKALLNILRLSEKPKSIYRGQKSGVFLKIKGLAYLAVSAPSALLFFRKYWNIIIMAAIDPKIAAEIERSSLPAHVS